MPHLKRVAIGFAAAGLVAVLYVASAVAFLGRRPIPPVIGVDVNMPAGQLVAFRVSVTELLIFAALGFTLGFWWQKKQRPIFPTEDRPGA